MKKKKNKQKVVIGIFTMILLVLTIYNLYIMYQNIEDEFADFNKNEIYAIMYFICRIKHEKHPDNTAIEALRTNYLKGKVMGWE